MIAVWESVGNPSVGAQSQARVRERTAMRIEYFIQSLPTQQDCVADKGKLVSLSFSISKGNLYYLENTLKGP